MADRRFDTGDLVTDYNLRRLEHLSRNDARGGEIHPFEIHIHATIDSLEMLPAVLRRHFHINPYVGDYHRRNDDWRQRTWTELARGIDAALTAVMDDAALQKGSGAELGDRPSSRGEQISAICKKLEAVYDRGGSWDAALAELERASSGTSVRSEVEAMKRLTNKKRIPDVGAWRSEMIRLIWRAHSTSQHLHHLRGPA
jgi:hypothetical protein